MTTQNMTLADLVTAGHYDWWNKEILKCQREDVPPTALRETELAHIGWNISTADAIAELDKRGYRPANAEELADYGAKNPDEQRKYRIVALGSGFVDPEFGHSHSPYLGVDGTERKLGLSNCRIGHNDRCRFLVVRK